ncbi:MAG: hypothetical protein H0T42_13500 [Deltaproteobacteria bacterium]|nr:hypothetical protein [Deltaproteobacteria bacterium]
MVNKLGLVCGLLAVSACAKDFDQQVAGRKVVEARMSTPSSEAPPGTLERRVLDLASCQLEGYEIVDTCFALRALRQELAVPGGSKELSLALGTRLLTNGAPAVRIEAAKLMGADIASRSAIVARARREHVPAVRQAFIHLLADDCARLAPVAHFLLESADHPTAAVRRDSLDAITSVANRGMPGAAAKIIAIVERDPDPSVRRAACALGGKLGDPMLVAMYAQHTATAADPELYASCMEGLVAMFHNHPVFDTASEPAYRLFLERLAMQPRSEQSPPWSVMSTFCYFSHDADLDKLAAWKQRAPWFDAAEVKRVIASVIVDKATSWMARTAAIESLVGLGATKAELTALRAGYDVGDPADRRVLAKLDSALGD